jgi:hypothetical protein
MCRSFWKYPQRYDYESLYCCHRTSNVSGWLAFRTCLVWMSLFFGFCPQYSLPTQHLSKWSGFRCPVDTRPHEILGIGYPVISPEFCRVSLGCKTLLSRWEWSFSRGKGVFLARKYIHKPTKYYKYIISTYLILWELEMEGHETNLERDTPLTFTQHFPDFSANYFFTTLIFCTHPPLHPSSMHPTTT